MDSGELDFYQHDKVCSNTCRSTKIDLSGARVSLSSPTAAEYLPLTPATADGTCYVRASRHDPAPLCCWRLGRGRGTCPPALGAAAAPAALRTSGWTTVFAAGKSQAFFQNPFVKKHVSPAYRSAGRTRTPTSPTPGPRRSLPLAQHVALGPDGRACHWGLAATPVTLFRAGVCG